MPGESETALVEVAAQAAANQKELKILKGNKNYMWQKMKIVAKEDGDNEQRSVELIDWITCLNLKH